MAPTDSVVKSDVYNIDGSPFDRAKAKLDQNYSINKQQFSEIKPTVADNKAAEMIENYLRSTSQTKKGGSDDETHHQDSLWSSVEVAPAKSRPLRQHVNHMRATKPQRQVVYNELYNFSIEQPIPSLSQARSIHQAYNGSDTLEKKSLSKDKAYLMNSSFFSKYSEKLN